MIERDSLSAGGALLFWSGAAFAFYVYAGYPLLLELLTVGRRPRRPPSRRAPAFRPGVTVIIAAFDEETTLARKLENTLALDYPPDRLEIIVAADGSSDGTEAIARSFEARGVRTHHEPERRGKAAALANAAALATGEVLVFSDANNLYPPDALRELVAPLAEPSVGAVSGAKRILESGDELGASEGLYWRYESRIKERESLLGSTVAVAGEIMAVRRSAFRAPPEGTINDDLWIALDLLSRGHRILYAPAAQSWEHVSPTLGDESVRRSRIVAGRYQALALHGRTLPWHRPGLLWRLASHKLMRPLVPFALLAMLLGNALWLAGGSTLALVVASLQVAALALALVGPYRVLPGPLGRVAYLAGFVLRSNLAAVTGLRRFTSRRQNAVWKKVRRRDEIDPSS